MPFKLSAIFVQMYSGVRWSIGLSAVNNAICDLIKEHERTLLLFLYTHLGICFILLILC